MNFEQMGGSEMGQGPRPDTIPPVSGRTSRADQAAATRRLRDEVLRLAAEQPRDPTPGGPWRYTHVHPLPQVESVA